MSLAHEINAILSISYRDTIKYLKNYPRIVFSIIFPVIFIGVLGGSLDSNLSDAAGYSFVEFTVTGVFAQTIFSTVAQGVISLIQDRENNLTAELFVSPISRYSIVLGKIFGEMFVALLQGVFIILFGMLLGVTMTLVQIALLIAASVLAGLLGGSFGVVVVSLFKDTKFANQLFPVIFFPQFFLAGVFNPIQELPFGIHQLSRAMPLTYIVDFVRNLYYADLPEKDLVTLFSLQTNFVVILVFVVVFLIIGTRRISRIEKEE